jgi:hypothetical protein
MKPLSLKRVFVVAGRRSIGIDKSIWKIGVLV